MVEITKDTAQYIRTKLPFVRICKTLTSKGGKKGKYYVEETMSVLKLIADYAKVVNVVEEYPVSK